MQFLVSFIQILFIALNIAILARILLTWIPIDPFHPIVRILNQVTEPILGPARRIIPPIGGIDFSPIIVLFLLSIVERLLLNFLG
jgi:YggT family protein